MLKCSGLSLATHLKECIVSSLSCVRLFVTSWTVADQAPLSMGFSRQEYWSGLPFPSPGDLPDLGIEPGSPTLQADALSSKPPGKPQECIRLLYMVFAGCLVRPGIQPVAFCIYCHINQAAVL